ncbi:MAG: class I SAM-dependent methyltransferase [Deltaproteobacteria bacterium]|nr:class I SAM-dependent methyltransferase [Deltaproteobacteria bacterium]
MFRDRGALWAVALDPQTQFGDAYAEGRIEVSGNLVALVEAVFRACDPERRSRPRRERVLQQFRRPAANTLAGSRRNIHHHYDLGNDFYRLWLDDEMVYTCAYFADAETSLEEAQRAKMDHVCRKLRLGPGERVVEAGCGWGSLALFMARRFGVTVRAFNISGEQIAFARERARAEGLSAAVEFVEDDYRNVAGRCDAFVSVGMLEHVGREHYRDLGEVIHRTLAPTGRGLLHSIGRNRPCPLDGWTEKRIFPGAYPPTLREMLEVLEPRGFSVLDVENLRLHYAKTLEHWLARYEANMAAVEERFDAAFVRAWRLYLAGSMASFTTGWLQLFQVLFARPEDNRVPWTRAYLYET